MWGRQTEKASAVESAVHTPSVGWSLHFIICPRCQWMQVKIDPMSHLSFTISDAVRHACVRLIPLRAAIPARQRVQTFSGCFSSDKWRDVVVVVVWGPGVTRQQPLWSCDGYQHAGRGATVQPDYRVAPLVSIFLTPGMKEWQYLWDKPVWDETDLHMKERGEHTWAEVQRRGG